MSKNEKEAELRRIQEEIEKTQPLVGLNNTLASPGQSTEYLVDLHKKEGYWFNFVHLITQPT